MRAMPGGKIGHLFYFRIIPVIYARHINIMRFYRDAINNFWLNARA